MQPHLHCSVYVHGKNKNNSFDIHIDKFVNCDWVDTRWQKYSTVHIYTEAVHRTTQLTTLVERLSGIRVQSGQTKINDELTA